MDHAGLIASVRKAAGNTVDQPDPYKLTIDFGSEIGTKRSSVEITKHYTKKELILVIGVVNFPPNQIGPFISETLTLGLPDCSGGVVLLSPTKEVPIGGKMF
jgi:tRNA-binding protein